MDLPLLIRALARREAYPFAVDEVEVRQTHISIVFLAGPRAYKIKKPVELGFLDFRTLERRQHFCAEEVRLNRRLAPHVYLGVVPVTATDSGYQFGGTGIPIEWAVEMVRLPDAATLEQYLLRDELRPDTMVALARRVADFHRQACSGPKISAFGCFNVVAGNARENFAQTHSHIGTTVSDGVYQRLHTVTEHHLELLQPLIAARAERHVPRDTHGDLHLDHVYWFPQTPPPNDLVIIDCIEFTERFRYADPIADMAFLAMDLKDHGRHDLARAFSQAYFDAAQDDEGRALLPFYTAYRAIVRAKVEGFKLAEPEVPAATCAAARQRARGHWLLALGELSAPTDRPVLVLFGGLPGSGKSTLAAGLAQRHGFQVVRSDVVRKELAGLPADARPPVPFRSELYAPEMTERTYAECLRRAEHKLWQGQRVIVDANFPTEQVRRDFLDAARIWAVPGYFIHCVADAATIRQRLLTRRHDASDADWAIYEHAVRHWEPLGAMTRRHTLELATAGAVATVSATLAAAFQALLEEL